MTKRLDRKFLHEVPNPRLLKAAIKAKRAGDMLSALRNFRLVEEQGERTVRCEIGYIYEHGGEGVKRDYAEAIRWYQKALVGERDEWALVSLARMHVLERGVSRDYRLARELYAEAANKGNPVAQLQYAGLLADGLGGEQDREKAIEYYEKAALQKNVFALTALAEYEKNRGRRVKFAALRAQAVAVFFIAYLFDRGSTRLRNI